MNRIWFSIVSVVILINLGLLISVIVKRVETNKYKLMTCYNFNNNSGTCRLMGAEGENLECMFTYRHNRVKIHTCNKY